MTTKPKTTKPDDSLNAAWDKIFNELKIVENVKNHGFFDVTSSQMKELTGKEPRLLSYIDAAHKLPTVMKKNRMAMLAIKNGTYRIACFNPFLTIPPLDDKVMVEQVDFPSSITTINPRNIQNESQALDAAAASGILEKVFSDDEINLTIRGRLRNAPFMFTMNNVKFEVDGVQIEVDGGYEGVNSINLVEAKKTDTSSFSLRQILYPEMMWKTLVQKKAVRSWVMIYNNALFRFVPFLRFVDPSTQKETCCLLVNEQRVFKFKDSTPQNLSLSEIKIDESKQDNSVPFPQADGLRERIIPFINSDTFREGRFSKDDVFDYIELTKRQGDYYLNTLKWLGLVKHSDNDHDILELTDLGRKITALPEKEQLRSIAEIIVSHPVFFYALRGLSTKSREWLTANLGYSESTINRRLRTVASWLIFLTKEFPSKSIRIHTPGLFMNP